MSGFAEFMFKHKIPSTAAAFSIGVASSDLARSMTTNAIIPAILRICKSVNVFPITVIDLPFALLDVFSSLVYWICAMFTSYFLMEIVFARTIVGASTIVLDNKEKQDLENAKEQASSPIKDATTTVRKFVNELPVVGGAHGRS